MRWEGNETMEEHPFLEVHVEFHGEQVKLQNECEEVLMIPFCGIAKGTLINGIVEPCGVDTQVVNAAGVRHMSARYMITGKDANGEEAHLYIENNGWSERNLQMPFQTVPTFYTDSKAIREAIAGRQIIGVGEKREDGLWICFQAIS